MTRALSIVLADGSSSRRGWGLAQLAGWRPASRGTGRGSGRRAAPATGARCRRRRGQKPDAVEPQGFTYNPDGRRDPFVSLLRRGADSAAAAAIARPAGLAGLGTAEVSLRGTITSRGRLRRHRSGRGQQDLHRPRRRQVVGRLHPIDHRRRDGHSAAGERSAFARGSSRKCGKCSDRRKRGSSGEFGRTMPVTTDFRCCSGSVSRHGARRHGSAREPAARELTPRC